MDVLKRYSLRLGVGSMAYLRFRRFSLSLFQSFTGLGQAGMTVEAGIGDMVVQGHMPEVDPQIFTGNDVTIVIARQFSNSDKNRLIGFVE
jgi:hypothetical protein